MNCHRSIHGLRTTRNGAYIFVMPATPRRSMMISSVTSMGNGTIAHGVRMFLQRSEKRHGHPVNLIADGIARLAIWDIGSVLAGRVALTVYVSGWVFGVVAISGVGVGNGTRAWDCPVSAIGSPGERLPRKFGRWLG